MMVTRQTSVGPRTENPEVGITIDAAGVRTNLHDVGDGPPVLLLHGSGPGVSAFANWRLAIPALGAKFRVIAPDIVGFGFTQRPANEQYSVELWLDHIVAVLDALGLTRVSVIGNSFGGAVALRLAIAEPTRVDRLILMGACGVAFPITDGLEAVWGYEPSVAGMQHLIDTFVFDTSAFDPGLAELRYRASARPGVQKSYAAMFPAPRQRWVDTLASPDDAVAQLTHETLIVHGRDDRVIPVEASIRLSALIDHSQLHIFGRCGHWVQLEQTDRFHRLVLDFLAEARRPPRREISE